MEIKRVPHRRLNLLTGEWVLVSPHRTQRPWQGKVEEAQKSTMPSYDPNCYLCPGNARAGGVRNPKYTDTFSFVNDFSALLPDIEQFHSDDDGLLISRSERGICKVICFSPRHNLTLAQMETADIVKVIALWQKEYREIGALDYISHIQIFENRGEVMGCSNPHPHCQIWANESVPVIPAMETEHQLDFLTRKKSCLLCSYIEKEREEKTRLVFENDSFVVLVPFWAVWPYEVMLLPKEHRGSILELTTNEVRDLADAMRRIGIKFDNLFLTSFPYSMGIHQKPTDGASHEEWHFHFHYYPPLLRSATVKKFMVGYEMLAMPQRDINPEDAAERLKECSEVHF
ncbi:MAG TPA: UDP-glucose--hexose-1-phosphate uridylyltransferase [Spirochaetia bacterium]|nr:UDP-glucose--hexose-1-phosphate uridylyltransferase [Spirochaetia bacterium]